MCKENAYSDQIAIKIEMCAGRNICREITVQTNLSDVFGKEEHRSINEACIQMEDFSIDV